jgi:medium-chain acyl-[acyl-carrier-protein] hydrolase
MTSSFEKWVSVPKPQPSASVRLICLPYAGAGAAVYRTWADSLPPYVEVNMVRLPGREARLKEAPYTRLTVLAPELADVLRPKLDRPFVLFGHSMGALIAFELSRVLRRQGAPLPAHVCVSGRAAPQLPSRDSPIHTLPDAEFLSALQNRYNAIPAAIADADAMMQLFLPILRADLSVIETFLYTPEAPLPCPISAYGGLSDERALAEELASWRYQTAGRFSLEMFPGDHFFLQSARAELLESLARKLSALQ